MYEIWFSLVGIKCVKIECKVTQSDWVQIDMWFNIICPQYPYNYIMLIY